MAVGRVDTGLSPLAREGAGHSPDRVPNPVSSPARDGVTPVSREEFAVAKKKLSTSKSGKADPPDIRELLPYSKSCE